MLRSKAVLLCGGATITGLLLLGSATSAAAQATPRAAPAAETAPEPASVDEVVVTGTYHFLSADTSGTTNLPVAIEKVPQTINLVSNDFIQAADLKTLGEIAQYTPGAVNNGNQLGFGSLINLRGFPPGRSVDGVNILGQTYYEPDNAIFERLEIVKGPSSVVYGVSSPGGLVNYVTKSATPQTPSYVSAQGGSWGAYRFEGQAAGAVDSQQQVRAIGIAVYDHADSFQNEQFQTHLDLYGGLNAELGPVSAYVHGGYEKFSRLAFDGVPTEADGSPAPVPRSYFVGAKALKLTTDVYHVEGNVTYRVNDQLELSLKGNYENSNTDGAAGYGYGLDSAGNISLSAYRINKELNENYGVGGSFVYHLDDLGLKKSFVSGALLYQHQYAPFSITGSSLHGSANIFDGQEAVSSALTAILNGPPRPSSANSFKADTLTASVQSVIQILDPLSVLFGVSWARPSQTVYNATSTQTFNYPDNTSYRAGVMYEVIPNLNTYVSYSQSFQEQGQFQLGGGVLPPVTGDQYEVGAKYKMLGGRLLLSAAWYDIRENNVGAYAETVGNLDYFKAIGKVKHDGVELQALGQITPNWQLNAGYSYLHTDIISDADESLIGKPQLYQPKQTISLYTLYTINDGALEGLSIGGGFRYVDKELTSYDGSTKPIPSYSLVDLNIGYKIDKWMLQFNIKNLFDKSYFINNYQTLYYGNFIGEPRSFSIKLRRDF